MWEEDKVNPGIGATQGVGHQVEGKVVAADGDDGVLHFLQRPQQLDFRLGLRHPVPRKTLG